MTSPETRVEELFVRYWDGALTPAQLAELESLLLHDPLARERFRLCNQLAVMAAEDACGIPTPPTPRPRTQAAPTPPHLGTGRKVPRRQFLRYAAAGLAAGVAGVAGGVYLRRTDEPAGMRITSVRGNVSFAGPRPATAGMAIPAGATVATSGPDSSAILASFDGTTTVTLTGDSAATLGDGGRQLTLDRGHASAELRQKDGLQPLTLATDNASFAVLPTDEIAASTSFVFGRIARATDVGVQWGRVAIADPRTGRPLAEAQSGEIVTIRGSGRVDKKQRAATPAHYAWDLSKPLPEGWDVGIRHERATGTVVVPEQWYDPYHSAELWQIRSDNDWTRGFVQLGPDSLLRVRYRVDRPGRSQICLCVRTPNTHRAKTGVLDTVTAFETARPHEWQWFERRAADMFDHKEKPAFPAPWVAFLMIVNTFDADLGLEIAEFRVTPPGGDAVT